jgi:16S rRNA processing protein RimM
MTKLENPVRMATIGAAHGVRGEVRVKTFTGDPMALGDYGPLRDENGRAYTVAALRPAKTVLVVRFREIASREAAEAAAGTALYVERAALPDDLEEDEFYHADLIGLAVRDETGGTIGKIAAMQDFGGGDIIEISLSGGKTVMVPFTLAAIPEIAVKAGFVRIDSVAAGLAGEDEAGDDEAGDEGE